jgi:hypothetical protein
MEKVTALTQEQNIKRLLFIGKCVDTNAVLPNSTKFGVSQPLTVQELAQLNNKTLEQLYVNIQKQVNEAGLGFKASKEPLTISGFLATEWMEFIQLTVQNRDYVQYKNKLAAQKAAIQSELEGMKTPSQKKKELQKKLAELED